MSFSRYICVILFVCSNPSLGSIVRTYPELQGDYVEDDMKLNPVQDFIRRNPFLRNGILNTYFKWQNGVVNYKISSSFDSFHSAYIRQAMNAIEEKTCIKFCLANANSVDYINIVDNGSGCNSYVGHQGDAQDINLLVAPVGFGCFRIGTIMHELIHALGFFHQQNSSDRDSYVEIKNENIQSGKEYNFVKYPSSFVTSFGVLYDYDSVMHYPATAFSKNGKPTIVSKDKTAVIGQRERISVRDIQKINIMYNCVGK